MQAGITTPEENSTSEGKFTESRVITLLIDQPKRLKNQALVQTNACEYIIKTK